MNSNTLDDARKRTRNRGRHEVVKYGVITGAILAGLVYLFTGSTGVSFLFDIVQRAVSPTPTTLMTPQPSGEPSTAVSLTPRPPNFLP